MIMIRWWRYVLTKNQEYLESEHFSNESVAYLTECIYSFLPRMHVIQTHFNFIHSFIPMARAECDDSLPFS